MKKNLRKGSVMILAMAFAVAFSSCNKKVDPTASFTYEPSDVMQYDEVQFSNTSTEATSYLWDFGGGQTATVADPKVTFLTSGQVTVKLTATNSDGSNTTEQVITVNAPDNNYLLGDVKYEITNDFFWFQSSMGGDPYLRLITEMPGSDTIEDLLKLYPNKGLGDLSRVYTWEGKAFGVPSNVGTYDVGYTGDYDGTLNFGWAAIGKTGSADLTIELMEVGVYKITGDMILSVGQYDFSTGEFIETSTETLKVSYIGPIAPLP
jgi:PKD repeat protein